MLDRPPVEGLSRTSGALVVPGQERRRALVACAALALVLHAAFIGHVAGLVPGSIEAAVAPMSIRTLPDALPADAPMEAPAAGEPDVKPPEPAPQAGLARRPREPMPTSRFGKSFDSEIASANSSNASVGSNTTLPSNASAGSDTTMASDPAAAASADAPTVAATADAPASAAAEVGAAPPAAAARGAAGVRPPLLAAGEEPPPVYRTQLPPSVTLHYEVRRGFLRGVGRIRWQASGERYRLALEAHVGGLMLLTQTSEGGIDANGLAPDRFLDQRASAG